MAQPVSLDPVNAHFLHWNGKPIICITSAEHYGAVLNADFDYATYLDTLAADGLNYTRIFTGSYVEPPGAFGIAENTLAPKPGRFLAPWKRSETPGYSNGGNKFDLEQWNPAYFDRLRAFLEAARARRIVVEVTLFCSVYADAQWKINPFNSQNNVNETVIQDRRAVNTVNNGKILRYQEAMTRKFVSELAGFDNLIYEIQNEPWADLSVTPLLINPYLPEKCVNEWQNKVDVATPASLEWQARIAQVIIDEEKRLGVKHLIAQNISNFRYPVREFAEGVSIINFHYAYPEAVSWNYGLNLPISYDESGFLPQGDVTYRRQAWNFILAGGAVFNNLDYSFVPGREKGNHGPIKAPGWGSVSLRKQLGILKRFVESLDFVNLKPDSRFALRAPGLNLQGLADPKGGQYALYLSGTGPSRVEVKLAPGRYRAEWISPETGLILKTDVLDQKESPIALGTPAFSDDVALRVLRQP